MRILLITILILTSSCSSICYGRILERLYFGVDTPDGPVTDIKWQTFLKDEVTPKFPAGLTVIEAKGQWLGENQVIVKEPSRILELIHSNAKLERASIDAIIANYKQKFKQEAVLDTRTKIDACL